MTRRIVVDAGLHKAGSTSIQPFLVDNASKLAGHGLEFYRRLFILGNHMELHAATMREERSSPSNLSHRNIRFDSGFAESTRQRLAQFAAGSRAKTLIFSAEGIS